MHFPDFYREHECSIKKQEKPAQNDHNATNYYLRHERLKDQQCITVKCTFILCEIAYPGKGMKRKVLTRINEIEFLFPAREISS